MRARISKTLRAKAARLLELYVLRLLQLEARSMLQGWMQGWRCRESLEGAGLEVYGRERL